MHHDAQRRPHDSDISLPALVLAGGRTDAVAIAAGVTAKGAVPVGGEAILHRIGRALINAKCIDDVVVIAPPELQTLVEGIDGGWGRISFLSDAGSLWENVLRGLGALNEYAKLVLFVAGDIPFLTANAVDAFVREAIVADADVVYPIITRECMERTYPDCPRTYVKLRDGIYTGGNCLLVHREVIYANEELIKSAIEARKKPWRLACILGLRFLVKMLLRSLTISDIEKRACQIMNCRVCAVVIDAPELAFDIDCVEHWEYAQRIATQH